MCRSAEGSVLGGEAVSSPSPKRRNEDRKSRIVMQARAQMTRPTTTAAIERVRPVLDAGRGLETRSAARQPTPAPLAHARTAENGICDLADRDIPSLDVFELQLLAARRLFEAWLP